MTREEYPCDNLYYVFTSQYDRFTLNDVINKISLINDNDVQVYGTKKNLAYALPTFVSDPYQVHYPVIVDGIEFNLLDGDEEYNSLYVIPNNGRENVVNVLVGESTNLDDLPYYGIYRFSNTI